MIDSTVVDLDFFELFLYPSAPVETDKMANALRNRVTPIDLEPIYRRKLIYNNKPVEIRKSKEANRSFGIAMCENESPIILIGSKLDRRISPYSLVFVIYHEYAHHLLGTSSCAIKRSIVPKDEIDADCKASELLQEYFPDSGTSIVIHTSGVLYQMNRAGGETHPGTIERANALLRGPDCVQWPFSND